MPEIHQFKEQGLVDVAGEAIEHVLHLCDDIKQSIQRLESRPQPNIQELMQRVEELADNVTLPPLIRDTSPNPLWTSVRYTCIFSLGILLCWGTLRWWPPQWLPPGIGMTSTQTPTPKKGQR